MLGAEKAPHLGAAALSIIALFPLEEQARFCLHLPETLQPINSDLGETPRGATLPPPKSKWCFVPWDWWTVGGLFLPHLAGSGPPDLGKAFLCQVFQVHLG